VTVKMRSQARYIVAPILVTVSGFAFSASDNKSDCLKHLGGGYGDAQCYQALRMDLTKENAEIYKSVSKSIPHGNYHARLLDEYMTSQLHAEKFCELQRDAGAKWEKSSNGTMYPAIYENCLYELGKAQNSFLNNLLEMSQW